MRILTIAPTSVACIVAPTVRDSSILGNIGVGLFVVFIAWVRQDLRMENNKNTISHHFLFFNLYLPEIEDTVKFQVFMIHRILRLCFMLPALTAVLGANAHDFSAPNDDGVEIFYNILSSEQKTVAVTSKGELCPSDGYSGITAIKIPGTVTHGDVTYAVTEIGNHAFYCCYSLTSVTFPETIQKIGEYAFDRCKLSELKLPASIKKIQRSAFSSNTLTNLDLQALTGLETLSSYSFQQCNQLTEVLLPNSLRRIEDGAFEDCSKLGNIEFPPNLVSIGYGAFKGTALTRIYNFPSSLKSIGSGAFMGCENLKHVYIPETINDIGGGAFSGSTPIIDIGNTRFKKFDGALYDAKMDTLICYFGSRGGEFVVPEGVKAVKRNAFSYNKNLTSIILPNSVEEAYGIAEYTTKLEYLKLPDAVKGTSLSGYQGNSALKEVVIPQNIKHLSYMCFYRCLALEKINLPEGLEYIEYRSLGYTNLKSIHIPSTVKKISYDALPALKRVDCDIVDIGSVTYDYQPDSDYSTIFGHSTGLSESVLVVPEGTVDEYKKQPNWNKFGVITDNTHTFSLSNDVVLSTKSVTPITVSMTNPSDIIGFQADIVLPEGVTIPRDENGDLKISLTSRADKTHIVSAEMNGNTAKMVVISMKNASFQGNEGPLFTFDVEVTGDKNEGTIELKNIILSQRGNTEQYLPPIWESYVIRNYNPGDTNDDGRVTVGDITCVTDYVLGREVAQFSTSAADMNGDGSVTVGDITILIDSILSTVDQTTTEQRGIRQTNESENPVEQPTEYFSFDPVLGEVGRNAMLNVNFNNASPFIAFQADIVLPEGVTIENDEYGDPNIQLSERAADHTVSARQVAGNTYRMVVISLKNRQFTDNEGVLFSCPLKLDCSIGEYEIQLKNLIISTPGNTEIDCPDFTGQLSVNDIITGIDTVMEEAGNDDAVYYNLQGIRVDNPSGGVYIRLRNGRTTKVMIK